MDELDPVIQNLMEDDFDILEVLSDSDSDLEADAQWQFMVQEALIVGLAIFTKCNPSTKIQQHQYLPAPQH